MHYILTCSFLFLLLFSFPAEAWTQNKNHLDTIFKAVKYRNVGPFRGGRSVCASGVPGDQLTYYMGTTGGGLWKTEDAGQRWKNISDGFFATGSVGAISVAPSNSNILYCGMGEHAPRGVMTHHGNGVYKSLDAGKTWSHIGLSETQHIARIIVHPDNPDLIYVAAQGALYSSSEQRGIFRSQDGGTTWEKVLYVNDRTGCSEISMDSQFPHILYATMWEHQRLPWKVISGGSGSGVYKSIDGGSTWNKIHKGLPKEKGKMAIAVSPSNSDKVYCLLESDSQKEKGGLFVSSDAGESWSRISADHRLIQRAWYYIEVFVDPKDENTVYVLSAPALRSTDGGKTWNRLTGTHGDYHDLWINPDNPKNMVIANDGGAAISFNYGKTWSTQSNMPTAQFYRVTVDNLFPYNIYGGQQDNSSVKIASLAMGSTGISESNWSPSAGGESAFLAFDPDNPVEVMGGSYLGSIDLLNTNAAATTRVMASPNQYLGLAARDMKYRYNWNAPIIKSMHEPNTYYHAAQILLRSRDNGDSWDEVSPDLSDADDTKLGKGGGPYTNEAVGAENYGTISYVAESPHEAGTIWVATDDGNVQLTRDNGENWQEVSPSGLKESLINSIDISPHKPGSAYIATTRYKFNDHTPGLYKTKDYGKTWQNISKGIPYGAFTRVVRVDPGRDGLLFAGTETGIYISWNDGEQWEPLQLNLPVTPITDLIVKHDDVIVATSGRSFWILDDLELFRQRQKPNDNLILYQPEPNKLANHHSPLNENKSNGTDPFVGVNPANGIVFYYDLPEKADSNEILLTITDSLGKLIRSLTSKADTTRTWDGGPGKKSNIGNDKGLNRFVWDMRHESTIGVPGVYIEGSWRGHKAIPGNYTATLRRGDVVSSTTLTIQPNPHYPTSQETYEEYDKFMSTGEESISEMHEMTNKLWRKHNQLGEIITELSEKEGNEALLEGAKALKSQLKAWDSAMVQRKSKAYDDVENYENGFTADYLFMINASESSIPKVNQASKVRKDELDATWQQLKKQGDEFIKKRIPEFNEQLWAAGYGAIWKN